MGIDDDEQDVDDEHDDDGFFVSFHVSLLWTQSTPPT